MTRMNVANNAESYLTSAITETDTTITVDDANVFPAVPFLLSIDQDEIVKVTEVSGNTLTVERGQEDRSAKSFDAGTIVENNLTAGMYNELVHEDEFDEHKADETKHITSSERTKWNKVVTDVGNKSSLNTTKKTDLVGAINEVFQTGNNVKSDAVDALLSVDDSLPITNESSWLDIIDAIGSIDLGINFAMGNARQDTNGTLVVRGLDFKPNSVIAKVSTGTPYDKFAVFTDYEFLGTRLQVSKNNTFNDAKEADVDIYEDGFSVKISAKNDDTYWYAIGEG